MATSTERFGFTKPAGSDPASVVPLNSNIDLIELYLGRTQDSIAPLYDDTETYSAGDLRTYESRLYKCNTDISTPETFDPEKWDLTTAVQEGGGSGGASAIEKTLSEYNALTPAQKENGSIYMVQGEGASEDAFDMTQGSSHNEGSMSFTATETDIESVWNGGGSIGGDWRTIAIDVTDLTAIKFSIKTTTCYAHNNSNVEEQTTPRFVNTVYLFTSIPSGWAYDYESQATDFLKFAYTNTDYGEQEFDVSELAGQLYIIWASTGWNAVMSDLTLVGKSSLNNRIFFMNEEYANTGGGTGAGAIEKTQAEYNALTPEQKNNGAIYMVQAGEQPQDISGTFVTGSTRYEKVEVNCGFRPDYIEVTLPFSSGDTTAIYDASVSTTTSTWEIPQEHNKYTIELGSETGETGITDITDTGFKFRCNASNTRGVTCTFTASKEGQDSVNKIYYMGTEYANTNGGSGGGGDGYKIEKIFDGNVTTAGNITLTKSLNNYDELIFVTNFKSTLSESYISTFNVDVSIFKNIGSYTATRGVLLNSWSRDARYAQVKYVDNTTIDVDAIQAISIVEIYGVKHSAGGGGGSSEAGDINYDNTTSQLTAENVQDAIDEVVANANTASEDILTLQNVQGYDAYDETQTYAVGDYAIYNNHVYECTTAVSTAEPFDASKWTETSIEQIIDGVKGDISQLNSRLSNSLTFTPKSGVIVMNQSIGAFNNIAYGTIEVKLTVAQSTWVVIGTINKHPAQMATFPCLRTGNGTSSGMVQITTDGIVQLYSTQALSGNAIAFSFNYLYIN